MIQQRFSAPAEKIAGTTDSQMLSNLAEMRGPLPCCIFYKERQSENTPFFKSKKPK